MKMDTGLLTDERHCTGTLPGHGSQQGRRTGACPGPTSGDSLKPQRPLKAGAEFFSGLPVSPVGLST